MRSSKSTFRFKKFAVDQDKRVFPVGTDAILLGAFATVQGRTCLDIGTGSGIVALIVAQKSESIEKILAIDVSPEAIALAGRNFRNSPWKKRLKTQLTSLGELLLPAKSVDLIVSNPPFFIEGLTPVDELRRASKHTDWKFFEMLFNKSYNFLNSSGRLSLIAPFIYKPTLIEMAESSGLHVIREVDIRPTTDKEYHRTVFEFSRTARKPVHESIAIMESGSYSAEFRFLTGELYLDF